MKNVNIYKKVIPYLIAGGLTFTTASCMGYTPFIKDKNIKELNLITKIDTNGNVTYEYNEITDIDRAVVEYKSKWTKKDDGYERNIDYYLPEEYTLESLKKIVEDKIVLNPSVHTVEKRTFINDEDLKNDKTIVTAYIVDNNSKEIEVKEKTIDNVTSTSFEIGIFILLCLGINKIETKRRKRK